LRLITLILSYTILSSLAFGWDNNTIDQLWRTENTTELEKTAQLAGYDALYANYRLAMIALENDDKKTARSNLDTIKKALKSNYKTPDEAALYSATLGLSIGLKPWQAAFIAGKAEKALEYSEEIETNHAPTLMVRGIALFNTPKFMGGDKQAALEYFNQAITLYSSTEAWGMEDAWLWKIKTLAELDRIEEANTAWLSLLEQYPDYLDAQRLQLNPN